MKHVPIFFFSNNKRVKLDEYIAIASVSDDSSNNSGEYYPMPIPNIPKSTYDHLLPDVT